LTVGLDAVRESRECPAGPFCSITPRAISQNANCADYEWTLSLLGSVVVLSIWAENHTAPHYAFRTPAAIRTRIRGDRALCRDRPILVQFIAFPYQANFAVT
jgi:hypothetical protein